MHSALRTMGQKMLVRPAAWCCLLPPLFPPKGSPRRELDLHVSSHPAQSLCQCRHARVKAELDPNPQQVYLHVRGSLSRPLDQTPSSSKNYSAYGSMQTARQLLHCKLTQIGIRSYSRCMSLILRWGQSSMFPAIVKLSFRRGNTLDFAFSVPSFSKIMTWLRHYTIINRLFSGAPKMFPVQFLRLQGFLRSIYNGIWRSGPSTNRLKLLQGLAFKGQAEKCHPQAKGCQGGLSAEDQNA